MMCINVLNSMIATEVLNDETKCSHKIITESTFTRSIREAHAWDRYRWHHRPLCKCGQGNEAVSGTYSPTHQAWRGS